jgi:YHS domain-containing protein
MELPMKLMICIACVTLSLCLFAGQGSAAADPTTMPAVTPTTTPSVAINKFCPVTREAVDPKIPTMQYKGMTIGFCCEDCIKDFKADPEKYMKNLK